MADNRRYQKKRKGELMPGTLVKCASGRFLAFYEHRTDIIANGENEIDARKNLREMYKVVCEHETEIISGTKQKNLPPHSKATRFTERID